MKSFLDYYDSDDWKFEYYDAASLKSWDEYNFEKRSIDRKA